MTRPVRIQRRRTKGFNLQAESRAINGLPAICCTRPGILGNPFDDRRWIGAAEKHAEWLRDGVPPLVRGYSRSEHDYVVDCLKGFQERWLGAHAELRFGEFIDVPVEEWHLVVRRLAKERLADANGACWCGTGQKCHVDNLLAWARS